MTEAKPKRPAHRPITIDAKRVNVSLDQATIDKAREIGGGNLSEGIRRAVSAAQANPA
jgi:hypothetical protein